MRRSNPGKSKKTSIPPISKDPKVFEKVRDMLISIGIDEKCIIWIN